MAFRKEYQPKDPQTGEPIGPPQVFEADTLEELADKLAAAHENASVKLYEVKKAASVGAVLDYDPEKPLRQLKSRKLTADERVRIAALRKDPLTADEALSIEMEALLGAPIAEIQDRLNQQEVESRTAFFEKEAQFWVSTHPEFIPSESNREEMWKYLSKKGFPPTRKNLELAYEAVKDKLVLRAPAATEIPAVVPPVEVPPAAVVVPPVETPTATPTENATPVPAEIPPVPTTDPAITETPEQLRARTSSSGLGRDSGSASSTPAAPKVKEITFAQINAMDSVAYAKFAALPGNKEAIEKLYAGTTSKTRA